MDIIIRTAVPEDCERIRPLQEQIATVHHIGRPDLFKSEARRFTPETFNERLADPAHTMLIAEAGNQVVGYAFAWVVAYRNHSTYIDFDSFYLDDICVLESHRRMGIGRMLFDRCVAEAQTRHCKNVELGVWAFNKGAIAFYESCGMHERVRRMELTLGQTHK